MVLPIIVTKMTYVISSYYPRTRSTRKLNKIKLPRRTICKKPLDSVPRPLQSMMLSLQRLSFRMEYHKGSSLHIADSLLRAPLPIKSQRQVHDGLVYRTELEFTSPDLSGIQYGTLQNIITTSSTDP